MKLFHNVAHHSNLW